MDFKNKRQLAVYGAYLSMLAYMGAEAQNKYISRYSSNYELIHDKHKTLQYFILKDHANKNTFISIRGTDTHSLKESIGDLGVSLKLLPRKIFGCKVHRGYSKSGDSILKKLTPYILENEYQLYFVGHSLGGVIAKYCGVMSGVPSTVLTYGAPKLAERDFYNIANNVDITCYVNLDDIIPQYPFFYDDCKIRNYFIMDDNRAYKYLGFVRGILLPLLSIAKATLLGNVIVGLKAHSIKNYIKNLSRLSKLDKK